MLTSKPKIVVMYLLWADEPEKYMARALQGIIDQTYDRDCLELLIVYNSAREGQPSSAPFIRNEIARCAGSLPHTTFLEQEKNLGFSGGNNLGMRWAMEHNFDYVFLHNADGFLHPEAIENLVGAMEADKTIGVAQPLILLFPDKNLINSAGNAWHFLGMGYCMGENRAIQNCKFLPVQEVGYVSGAASILRTDLLLKYGIWKEEFFLYHEDTEYSLRLKFLGYKTAMISKAIFYHQYEFKKRASKFFWIERNRHAVNLLFYKWPTLVLLFPLEAAYNIGLLIAAAKDGWTQELFRVFEYWMKPDSWKMWLNLRREIQGSRKISDRELIKQAAARVASPSGEKFVGSPLQAAGNAIFTIYYLFLKLVIWW